MKRLVLDVYDEIHTQFKLLAFSQGLTMQQLLEQIVKEYLEKSILIEKKEK